MLSVCALNIKSFFLPADIQHTQCPRRFFILERYKFVKCHGVEYKRKGTQEVIGAGLGCRFSSLKSSLLITRYSIIGDERLREAWTRR